VLASAALSAPAFANVVYEQAGTAAPCAGFCWTSTYGDDLGGYQTLDDFTLTADADINKVTWRGFIKANGAGPADPVVEDWQISFSADSAGAPGSTLFSVTLPAADVSASLLGVGLFQQTAVNIYEFSAQLPTSFSAAAGTKYWFSPLALQETFFPFFAWSPASPRTGTSFQVGLPSGDTFVRQDDRAFSLASVPEPQTWALMLLGFGAAGAALRRRRVVSA
jgi:hypothetical protein